MVDILLVEDSVPDSTLLLEIFEQQKIDASVWVVRDGIEALAFLNKEETHKDAPRPDLVILDLNMPRMDGRELLSAIKRNSEWATIPVLILSTSNADEDILATYSRGANCYIPKPFELRKFSEIVKTIDQFWFRAVALPIKSELPEHSKKDGDRQSMPYSRE